MTVFGLLQFRYDKQKKKFVKSNLMVIYSLSFAVTLLYFYPTICVKLVASFNPLIAIAIGYLTTAAIFIFYIVHYVKRMKIMNFLNKCLKIINDIDWINSNQSKTNTKDIINEMQMLLGLFLGKIIANCVMIESLMKLQISVYGDYDFTPLILCFIANILYTIVGNIFYGCCLLFANYYEEINYAIDDIIKEAQSIDENGRVIVTEYYIIMKCCELSDRLDRLAISRMKLFKLFRRLNELCSIQLLTSIIAYFGVLLIEVVLSIYLC